MVVLLLFMGFPPSGVVAMLVAAAVGAAIPLPKVLRNSGRYAVDFASSAAGSGDSDGASTI